MPTASPTAEMLQLVAMVALWATSARHLRRAWRSPRQRVLASAASALAAAMTLSWTPLGAVLVEVTGVRYLDTLLKHLLGVAAFAAAFEFAADVTGGRGRARTRYATAGGAAVAMSVFFALAPREPAPTPDLLTAEAGALPVAAYAAVFLGYLSATLAVASRMFWRYARQASEGREGSLRAGLLLVTAGGVVGLAYTVWRAVTVLGQAAGVQALRVNPLGVVPTGLLVGAFVLILGGTATPAAGRVVGRYRSLRRLYPLWRVLCEVAPHVALSSPTRRVADVVTVRDGPLRLYRRVIEIRDGMLALRGYASHEAYAAARARAEQAGLRGAALEAAAQACHLELARRAKAGAGRRAYDAVLFSGETSGFDEEVRWLARLARAYQSPLVQRLADDLESATVSPASTPPPTALGRT